MQVIGFGESSDQKRIFPIESRNGRNEYVPRTVQGRLTLINTSNQVRVIVMAQQSSNLHGY